MPGEKSRLESPKTTGLTAWQQFYQQIRDPAWPDCSNEDEFHDLPGWIQDECRSHGYHPGEYRKQPLLAQRSFPIKTTTACQLKWNWSTIFMVERTTASCHRTNHHTFDQSTFDFHNTSSKLDDRRRMLQNQWPEVGCDYCRDIERAHGQSDRMTNLDMPGIHAPPELDHDAHAVRVTPRILEVYFDSTCNLKCTYCGPHFSTLWQAENRQHGTFKHNGLILSNDRKINPNMADSKKKLFQWMAQHGSALTNFNILGGEPLYQKDLDDTLGFFDQNPMPQTTVQIFTNLYAPMERLTDIVGKVQRLVDSGKISAFDVTASLDCWGAAQEYARFPLKLDVWQRNFEYLLSQKWIRLIVGSTVTPLTVHTLWQLIEKLNQYRQTRSVYHYFNSVNTPSYMFIDILGRAFEQDFDRAIEILPDTTPDEINVKNYLRGIARQSISQGINHREVLKLLTFLDEMDRRRGLSWRDTFPWLIDPINQAVDQKRA